MNAVFAKCDIVANATPNGGFSIASPQQSEGKRGFLFYNCDIREAKPLEETSFSEMHARGYFGRPWQAKTSEMIWVGTNIGVSSGNPGTSNSVSIIYGEGFKNDLGGTSDNCYEFGSYESCGRSQISGRADWVIVKEQLDDAVLLEGTVVYPVDSDKGPCATFFENSWSPFVGENMGIIRKEISCDERKGGSSSSRKNTDSSSEYGYWIPYTSSSGSWTAGTSSSSKSTADYSNRLRDYQIELAKAQYSITGPHGFVDDITYDCLWFGKYWQEDTNEDGIADTRDEKTPVKWRVLEVKDDKAVLISDRVLDVHQYNESAYYSWHISNIKKWLNSEKDNGKIGITGFLTDLTADNPSDRLSFYREKVSDEGTGMGYSDYEYVFLPSWQQISKYSFDPVDFIDSAKERQCGYTEFARDKGLSVDGDRCSYWLREPYSNESGMGNVATVINSSGIKSTCYCDSKVIGVRPMIVINLPMCDWAFAGTVNCDGIKAICPFYENEHLSYGNERLVIENSGPKYRTVKYYMSVGTRAIISLPEGYLPEDVYIKGKGGSIDKNAKITAFRKGTVKVYLSGMKKPLCVVKIEAPKFRKSYLTLTRNKDYAKMKLKGTKRLSEVRWKVSDESAFNINSSGFLKWNNWNFPVTVTAVLDGLTYRCEVNTK